MDEIQFYGSVNIISVILGKSKGDIERLCSIKPHLQQKRLLPPARIEHVPGSTTLRRKCCTSKAVPCPYPNPVTVTLTQTKCGLEVSLGNYQFKEYIAE